MSFLGNFLKGDNDEVLFFILVFLLLFNGNGFGKSYDSYDGDGNSTVLFFIIVFLLLFFNNGFSKNYTDVV